MRFPTPSPLKVLKAGKKLLAGIKNKLQSSLTAGEWRGMSQLFIHSKSSDASFPTLGGEWLKQPDIAQVATARLVELLLSTLRLKEPNLCTLRVPLIWASVCVMTALTGEGRAQNDER